MLIYITFVLLRIHEELYYISFVAEITNIIYYLSMIFDIVLPKGFSIGMAIFNFIYLVYVAFIVIFIRGKFRKSGFIILSLTILKKLFWKDNLVISIIDSIVCIIVLILYHRFIYDFYKQIENERKEIIEIIEQLEKEEDNLKKR